MIIRLIELQISGSLGECLERYCSASVVEPLPDLVVFPELFCVGYVLDRIPSLALSMNELREHSIGTLAAEKGIWFAPGTFPVSTEAGVVNRFPVFSPEGDLVWFTDKVHMFRNMNEDSAFTAGSCGGVFDLDGICSSGIVCYDLRFPELSRMVSLMGARLIIVPSEWPEPRLELFRALLMARAAEAQVFVAGCNLGGEHLGVRFGGGGAVAHPSGKLLGWKDVIEGVRDFEIDPDDVLRIREKIDCLADRRPGAYEPSLQR
jgi:predicted amidohydrolase